MVSKISRGKKYETTMLVNFNTPEPNCSISIALENYFCLFINMDDINPQENKFFRLIGQVFTGCESERFY